VEGYSGFAEEWEEGCRKLMEGWGIDTFLHGFGLLCLSLRLRWVDGLFLWHLASM
jgi:hypothetical protein